MSTITGEDIIKKRQSLAYFHTAIFEKADLKVLASCVTFASDSSVPPGFTYNVSELIKYHVHYFHQLFL